jgi:hypothetical protein
MQTVKPYEGSVYHVPCLEHVGLPRPASGSASASRAWLMVGTSFASAGADFMEDKFPAIHLRREFLIDHRSLHPLKKSGFRDFYLLPNESK